ncbi:hypothetical protein AB1Y20_017840 [Prymnesium parvum]|uniref:Peroxisomal membrane protein MPV17 n=1 Tax=Prymnesium parvum TaxID=97485 RepID=A0AB34JMV5_PRYPA
MRVDRLGATYSSWLQRHPLRTKAVTGGLIMTAADTSQQHVERERALRRRGDGGAPSTWDANRTLRLVSFYSLFQMPFVHVWFGFLERRFGAVTPRSDLPRFIAKLAVDQCIGFPTVLATFCCVQPVLQGQGIEGAMGKLQRDLWAMVRAGWQVWFPANFVIFAAVPLHFRPLMMNIVSLGWSVYMSSMSGYQHSLDAAPPVQSLCCSR